MTDKKMISAKKKLTVFVILMCLFGALTLVGGILVVRCDFNVLYSLLPAFFAVVFSVLCRFARKRVERLSRELEQNDEPDRD